MSSFTSFHFYDEHQHDVGTPAVMSTMKMKGSETTVECPMVLISEIQGGMGGMGVYYTGYVPYTVQATILNSSRER